jgi:hypothetical protein
MPENRAGANTELRRDVFGCVSRADEFEDLGFAL